MVKIIDNNYTKAYLEQVADNATHLNAKERTLLPSLIKNFEDLFDGTLGNWFTEPIDLELKPYSKIFNSIYFTVPRINKIFFWKELKRLV